MSAIIIRQATLKDKDALWEFIKNAYEGEEKGLSRFKFPKRWIWQFTENPFFKETGDKLPIWIALKDDRIVGQICFQPVEVKIGDKIYNASYGSDMIVSKDCRGGGIAPKIYRSLYNHTKIHMTVEMSPYTRNMKLEQGSYAINSIYEYWYFVKMNKDFVIDYSKKRTKRKPKLNRIVTISSKYFFVNIIFSIVFNLIMKFLKIFKVNTKKRNNSEIVEIYEFNDEHDDFFNKTYKEYNAIVIRDKTFLNWRFFGNKQMDYHSFVLKQNGTIKGYIVLRKPDQFEFNIGVIADIYAAKNDIGTIKELLCHAIRYFDESVVLIKCYCSLIEYNTLLKKIGFFKIREIKPLIQCASSLTKKKLDQITDGWFMTGADQDVDQIQPK